MISSADPKAGYLANKNIIDRAIQQAMESGWYIQGPKVRCFEEAFATYLQTAHCIAVASGSDAVQFALRACGVKAGDGVITVAHTAVATVSAIDWIGAKAVLVDISPETFTISPERVEETLRRGSNGSIKAIVAVHLYGHPAEMTALTRIAKEHAIPLIEDCAQAHGAMLSGQKVGTIGACGAFSFYPTKNLGAFGDGGAVVTRSAEVADRLRLLQQYGWRERYISEETGYNSRLDELQAAILNCRLPLLDDANQRRREIAQHYTRGLAGLPVRTPVEGPGAYHVYHQYVIRLADREALRRFLEARGIKTAILYPMPIHLQPGYRGVVTVGAGGLATTEEIAREILCLPIYPELRDDEVETVIAEIRAFFQ